MGPQIHRIDVSGVVVRGSAGPDSPYYFGSVGIETLGDGGDCSAGAVG